LAINPKLVEGQIEGGAAQAMGAALWEQVLYDENGQNITTTLADYVLPTAAEIPPMTVLHMETPAPDIPGGMKGVGEGGMIPTGAAIARAVEHAVGDLGIEISSLPVTPPMLLELITSVAPVDV
jgi:carbon-monoxide dehydrogenase large subunit